MAKREPIKIKDIRKLAALQCTKAEAAGYLNVGIKTFQALLKDPRAAEAWENGKEGGKASLRRKQYRLASTSSSMGIFLGKQYLGQKDVSKHEVTHPDGGPLTDLDLSKLSEDERRELRSSIKKARVPRSDPEAA